MPPRFAGLYNYGGRWQLWLLGYFIVHGAIRKSIYRRALHWQHARLVWYTLAIQGECHYVGIWGEPVSGFCSPTLPGTIEQWFFCLVPTGKSLPHRLCPRQLHCLCSIISSGRRHRRSVHPFNGHGFPRPKGEVWHDGSHVLPRERQTRLYDQTFKDAKYIPWVESTCKTIVRRLVNIHKAMDKHAWSYVKPRQHISQQRKNKQRPTSEIVPSRSTPPKSASGASG